MIAMAIGSFHDYYGNRWHYQGIPMVTMVTGSLRSSYSNRWHHQGISITTIIAGLSMVTMATNDVIIATILALLKSDVTILVLLKCNGQIF